MMEEKKKYKKTCECKSSGYKKVINTNPIYWGFRSVGLEAIKQSDGSIIVPTGYVIYEEVKEKTQTTLKGEE